MFLPLHNSTPRTWTSEILWPVVSRASASRWRSSVRVPQGLCIKTRLSAQPYDMEMSFHSHANKTHFHKKGCALGLTLKVRVLGTRKWPIWRGFKFETLFNRLIYIIEIRLWVRPLRWLDTVFQGQYLPSLSVNYVAINKDLEKLTPQLY